MTSKIYAMLALVAFLLAIFFAGSKYQDMRTQNKLLVAANKAQADTIAKERKNRENAEKSRDQYLQERDKTNAEIENLKRNVTVGTTILRVPTKCPTPKAGTDTGRAPAADPELAEHARPAYYTHIADEDKIVSLLHMCVRQLKIDRGLQ